MVAEAVTDVMVVDNIGDGSVVVPSKKEQQSESLFQKCSALMSSTIAIQGAKDALLFGNAAIFVIKERMDDIAGYRSWIIVKRGEFSTE